MKMTRKQKVLELLRAHHGTWVPASGICHWSTGGSEGLRRLRELRAEGHTIEMRVNPVEGRTERQYRLVDEPPDPTPPLAKRPPALPSVTIKQYTIYDYDTLTKGT